MFVTNDSNEEVIKLFCLIFSKHFKINFLSTTIYLRKWFTIKAEKRTILIRTISLDSFIVKTKVLYKIKKVLKEKVPFLGTKLQIKIYNNFKRVYFIVVLKSLFY